MAYTSNKLCHFVGRRFKTDLERINLLVNIIREGTLRTKQTGGKDFQSQLKNSTSAMYQNGEAYTETNCVCFCDIPDNELGIHTQKYSKFGLGFKKDFILSQGARPVIYIPDKYPLQEAKAGILSNDSKAFFPALIELATYTASILGIANKNNEIKHAFDKNRREIKELKAFNEKIDTIPIFSNEWNIWGSIFTITNTITTMAQFVKIFDSSLEDSDPNNYYMEREWRCLNDIKFTENDIVSVYLPNSEFIFSPFIEQFPHLRDKIITLAQ